MIDSDIEEEDCYNDNNKENKLASKFSELEYQEHSLTLKEHELSLREREAKIYTMELTNIEKECKLNLVE